MGGLLSGIRVVEVAMWGFVPSAAVALADWGADVVKIEHPVHGDPLRGLLTSGGGLQKFAGANFMWELFNRGKRSVGLDIRNPEGLDILHRLVEGADVFLTSFLPEARARLGIEVADLRAKNPRLVYGRGSGMGPEGPEANRGGYDAAAFWSRSGVAYKVTPPGASISTAMPAPAFGDIQSGLALAGGIAAALAKRERTGEPSVVDVSLLNVGMWAMSAEITATALLGQDEFMIADRRSVPNPIVAQYRTKDDRFVQLVMLEADLHWPDLCQRVGRPDLADDPRFGSMALRAENSAACVAELEAAFATRTLAEWKDALAEATGVWAPVQGPREIPDDPQVQANGYVRPRQSASGAEYLAVSNPVRADGLADDLGPAPEHGQHTEEVLLELGCSWEQIARWKDSQAIL